MKNFRKKRLVRVFISIKNFTLRRFRILLRNLNRYFLQYNTGLYLESLAVELVVLAIWKKALDICSTWSAPISKNEFHGSSSVNESVIACGDASLSHTIDHKINFNDRASVSLWAKHGFINAVDRAEKLSYHIQNMDGRISFVSKLNTFI